MKRENQCFIIFLPVIEDPVPSSNQRSSVQRYEYERNCVSNLFMLSTLLDGWRHVKVTDRQTKQYWIQLIKELVGGHFSDRKIILVMDNLNTHKLSP